MIEKYGLKHVVNASGKMTILGGSTVDRRIFEEMNLALEEYVEMENLVVKSGEYISKMVGCEDAFITTSASAGIVLTVASLITGDSLYKVENLHKIARKESYEILIQKGHNINYGAPLSMMVELGGATLVEAGFSNECKKEYIEGLINEKTKALLYVKSHHTVQKNMLSLNEMKELAQKYKLPLIIDAAAEESLNKYLELGDVIIYSGTKAIEGPTSGIVLGKKEYIKNIRLQNKGMGRAMKIGRENIFGIMKAIQLYLQEPKKQLVKLEALEEFANKVNQLPNVESRVLLDDPDRKIYRVELKFEGVDAIWINNKLRAGEIAVYTRDYYKNIGKLYIDPRPLKAGDLDIIYKKLKAILEEERN